MPHLAFARAADPLDGHASRALADALRAAGDEAGFRRLARDVRLLHAAAPTLVKLEAWAAEAPPAGDELASVLVLCCNEVDATRTCLESVLRHARPPYELVLVNNGSSDGTPAYLAEIAARVGPERVAVLRSEANVGYAAGVNRGLAEAKGEYVVLLNNDTQVGPGWLDGLVARSLHDWPRVGLVGPVSDNAPVPQHVPLGSADLDAFAAARRIAFRGKAQATQRLTGFCLLVRRAVLEKVGALDERYGLGFFEDDDLCVRARRAGFQLLVALDVFVRHDGSRTVKALGLDARGLLRENFGKFKDKWGDAEAAPYRLPDGRAPDAGPAATVPATPPRRPRVSATMIVRDEEHHLPDCLASLRGLADELVVVDTGSRDKTKDIAASFGAKVSDFVWVDDFAAARNAALDRATGDYAFWMDADDRLDDANRAKFRALLDALDPGVPAARVLTCRCDAGPGGGPDTAVHHVRLFPRLPGVRWDYRVHEQILPALRKAGVSVKWSDVSVRHVGYADPAARKGKLDRDLRLLTLDRAARPQDPFILFNLACVHQELGDHARAEPMARESLNRSHRTDSIVRKLYAILARGRLAAGDWAGAAEACRAGLRDCPGDAELLFVGADALARAGDFAAAEAMLRDLVGGSDGEAFASVPVGLRGELGRHRLCEVLLAKGDRAALERELAALAACGPGGERRAEEVRRRAAGGTA